MSDNEKYCGNCQTVLQENWEGQTLITVESRNGQLGNVKHCDTIETISVSEALWVIFQIPPSPNFAAVLNSTSGKSILERKREEYRTGSLSRESLSGSGDEGGDYGCCLCGKCAEILTNLYNCFQNFINVCQAESLVGKGLQTCEKEGRRVCLDNQDKSGDGRRSRGECYSSASPGRESPAKLVNVKVEPRDHDNVSDDGNFCEDNQSGQPLSPADEHNNLSHEGEEEPETTPVRLIKMELEPPNESRPRRIVTKNRKYVISSDTENSDDELINVPSGTPLGCPKCGKEFLHANTLACHRRIVHREGFIAISRPAPIPQLPFAVPKSCNVKTSPSDATSTCFICHMEVPRHVIEMHLSTHTRSIDRPWMCTICGREFDSYSSLLDHANVHKATVPCRRCGKRVARLEMIAHFVTCLKNKHNESSRMLRRFVGDCKLCAIQFTSKEEMVRHMQRHKQKKAFTCKICSKAFDRLTVLQIHIRRFHRNNDAPPSVLKPPELEDGGADDALEDVDNTVSTGEIESSSGPNPNENQGLIEPEIRPFMEERFRCKVCELEYSTVKELEGHLMDTHGDKTNLMCLVCNRKFQDNFILKLHLKIHAEAKPLVCFMCSKVYRDRGTFLTHLIDTHKLEQKIILSKYPNVFKRMFSLKPGWRTRNSKNIGQSPSKAPLRGEYPCEICGKIFPYVHAAVKHKKLVHDKIKDFICSYCGKGFGNKSYFLIHERLHTSTDAPYKCHLCGKGFRMPGTLRMHLRSAMHNPNKSYICDVCGKGFNRADNMRLHVKAVHLKLQTRNRRDPLRQKTGRRRLCDYVPSATESPEKVSHTSGELIIPDPVPGTSRMFQHGVSEHHEASSMDSNSNSEVSASDTKQFQQSGNPVQHSQLSMPIIIPLNPGSSGHDYQAESSFFRGAPYR